MVAIVRLTDPEQKKSVVRKMLTKLRHFRIINRSKRKEFAARKMLEALEDWFGIPEAREEYITGSADQPFWCACENGEAIGFATLKEAGKDTAELCVMGVLKGYQRQWIGRQLFEAARSAAEESGCSFLQVKTVQSGFYPKYDRTNLFYRSMGFREFEVFPLLWDEWNPCQVYVMALHP